MSGFGFDTLAVIAVIGVAGPLLASMPRFGIPVVIGELVAGLVVASSSPSRPSCPVGVSCQ